MPATDGRRQGRHFRHIAVALTGAGAVFVAAAQVGIYTCVDAQGRRLTADRPIAACIDREQRELNPSGTVRRTMAPVPTERERLAEEERRHREADARARQQDELRRDRALVLRYPGQPSHDADRQSALRQVEESGTFARERIAQLQRQRQQLDKSLAVFHADPSKVPPVLRQELLENTEALAAQQKTLAEQDRERQRVTRRYDTELFRLQELWATLGGVGGGTAGKAGGTGAPPGSPAPSQRAP